MGLSLSPRALKLFPMVGLYDEGLEKYAKYLCEKVATAAQGNLRQALEAEGVSQVACTLHVRRYPHSTLVPLGDRNYVNLLAMMFEGIAKLIEREQPIVETSCGTSWT